MGAVEWFQQNWRAFMRLKRPSARQRVTVAFRLELVERLRLAVYWSKRSVTALLEEEAVLSLRTIEKSGGLMQAPGERMPQVGLRGRWAPTGSSVAALPNVPVARNGDLFVK